MIFEFVMQVRPQALGSLCFGIIVKKSPSLTRDATLNLGGQNWVIGGGQFSVVFSKIFTITISQKETGLVYM